MDLKVTSKLLILKGHAVLQFPPVLKRDSINLKSITDKILLNVKPNGPFCNMGLKLNPAILSAPKT